MKKHYFITIFFLLVGCSNDCPTIYKKKFMFSQFELLIPSELVKESGCIFNDMMSNCINITDVNGVLDLRIEHYLDVTNEDRVSMAKKTTIDMLRKRNPDLSFEKILEEKNKFIIAHTSPTDDNRVYLGVTGMIFNKENVIEFEYEQRPEGTKSRECLLKDFIKIFDSYN